MELSSDETNRARDSIRQKLNNDKVKLWLPPFTTENGQKGDRPHDLISAYSSSLGLPESLVETIIEELRLHALQKLNDRRAGQITLNIKYAGHCSQENPSSPHVSLPGESVVTTNLRSSGRDLKNQISVSTGISFDRLKLIAAGHVIEDDIILELQHIRNNGHVMALCLSTPEVRSVNEQQQAAQVARMREAAELISSHDAQSNSSYDLHIANQSGKRINLPLEERKALMLAMMLHEKGRAALKRREFGEALIFLLEADKEFRKCPSNILDLVDNYAIVCLDIVWCYLCLQNITSLPDAEVRLNACETCFHKSYGTNLERLMVVKGGTGEEAALFVRLHLLQGVLAYHQQRNNDAKALFDRADNELRLLKTNEDDMTHVMEMGFTELEARLGLRACRGDVQQAVGHIVKRREDKRIQAQKDKEEKQKKSLAHKLGRTAHGELVNVDHYNTLVSMGFPKGAVAESLRQADNDVTLAYQILHEKPELLNLPDPDPPSFTITDEMIDQLAVMGFDPVSARAALHHFRANIEQAVEELIRTGGFVPVEWTNSMLASSSTNTSGRRAASTSSSSSSGSDTSVSSTSSSASQKREQREHELMEEIMPDIPQVDEDYLDLTLDDEAAVLSEYQARLLSLE